MKPLDKLAPVKQDRAGFFNAKPRPASHSCYSVDSWSILAPLVSEEICREGALWQSRLNEKPLSLANAKPLEFGFLRAA